MAEEKAILYDSSKCIACRACQVACKEWNQNPGVKTEFMGTYENPPSLGAYTWMRILFHEYMENEEILWYFTKHQCMHCTDAACVEVCPPKATKHEEYQLDDGTVLKRVVTEASRCIGCNYCRVACPFDVPGYDQKQGGMFRCTMCVDRTTNGMIPACVKSCNTGALTYGDRSDLIVAAEERVKELKAEGYSRANLYGKDQLGGLRYLYVFADEPEAYGLPNDPSIPAGATLWNVLAKPYGAFAAGGIAAALGINAIINARNRGLEEKYKLKD